MKFKIKKSELKKVLKTNESWIGFDSMPAKLSDNIPQDQEKAVVTPMVNTQPSDIVLPIDDDKWEPADFRELGFALKALSEQIPAQSIKEFWKKAKKLSDKLKDQRSSNEEQLFDFRE